MQVAPTLPINLEDRLGSSARMGRIHDLAGFLIAVYRIDLKHRKLEFDRNSLNGVQSTTSTVAESLLHNQAIGERKNWHNRLCRRQRLSRFSDVIGGFKISPPRGDDSASELFTSDSMAFADHQTSRLNSQ
jgi:hypothetical protein